MAEKSDSIIDERNELIVSLSDDNIPILRTAHFLKPSVTSINDTTPELPSVSCPSSLPPTFEPSKWPLKVIFNGWRNPTKDWKNWVHFLRSKYEAVWKEAGIYEAIMNSNFEIEKDENLVLGVAERWNSETKSFNFTWAEATITLEDVMVLGGYSVLGDSVLSPLESTQMNEIHEKLIQARLLMRWTSCRCARQSLWIKMFMGSGSDIEHEAFLVTWLSMFVFANSASKLIRKTIFPIAIHLARGTRIALAPAVLATIYKDLSLLKEVIVASTKFDSGKNGSSVLELNLMSPFQLLQLWALERFRALQPQPNFIKRGDPFFARWHRVKMLKPGNVRLALGSAGESFQWRPYTTEGVNWNGHELYGEKAMWVSIGPNLDEQQESFVRFLRVSKLVGIDCIEQYLPHRVAMQFGMDQDLPGCVVQSNKTPEVAWTNFSKPLVGAKLYIPSRHFKAGVTAHYSEWRKRSLDLQDAIKGTVIVKRKRSRRPFQEKGVNKKMAKALQKAFKEENGDYNADVPPGFPPKCNYMANKAENSIKVEPMFLETTMTSDIIHCNLENSPVCDGKNLGHPHTFSASTADNNRDAGKKKLLTESIERIKQSCFSMRGLKRTMNFDLNERNAENPDYGRMRNCRSKTEGCSQVHETLWFEYEARLNKLERAVAELQAERFGQTRLV